MTLTIKINQKHIERLAFSLIIIVLLGLLINEKYNVQPNPQDSITGYQVKELLPTNIKDTPVSSTTSTTVKETTTTKAPVTTTTTSTTTTTMLKEMIISVTDIKTEKIDDKKGKINSFKIKVINGLDHNINPIIKYYIYDKKSSSIERMNPKKPDIEINTIPAKSTKTVTGDIEKYEFDLDLVKTLKVEVIDEDYGIIKTSISKITIK